MVDTTFRTVLPALKAIDNGDGTYSMGVKLSSSSVYATGRCATYVIAASDAPAHVKAQADYVCDGTADDVQIQAAIDALTNPFGRICLSSGTFYIASPIVIHNKMLALWGQGVGETTLEQAGEGDIISWDSTVYLGAIFPEIKYLMIKGHKDTYTTGRGIDVGTNAIYDLRVQDVFILNMPQEGIYGGSNGWGQVYSNVVVEYNLGRQVIAGANTKWVNCKFVDNYASSDKGLFEFSGSGSSVINSEFTRSKGTSASCQPVIFSSGLNRFSGNNMWDCGAISLGHLFMVATSKGNIITDNTFSNIPADITIFRETLGSSYGENVYTGNNIYDNGIIVVNPTSIVANNQGYINRGEIRTYSGTIATLTENAFNSVDNPFGQSVRVLSENIYISTGATATTPNIDCGIGSSATTDYTTLFDDLPGETVGFYNSLVTTPGAQTVPQLWASGSGNRYLNHSIKGAAATGMVATYTVTVMGV
jgi:hypothetical protein